MIHPSAEVQTKNIGENTNVWQHSIILKHAIVGDNCNVNCNVFIENEVIIGDHVTIKSGVYLWDGLTIGDHVFIGPNATFTNDKYPRYNKTRRMEGISWKVGRSSSIGANVTILPGVNIGENASVGAGSVVTKDVPAGMLSYGNPAEVRGKVRISEE